MARHLRGRYASSSKRPCVARWTRWS